MTADTTSPTSAPAVALVRTRRLATGALVLMAAVFLLSHVVAEPSQWVRLARSVAEAGLVGGLADWFAVTALFRHPLGLPIPHTALLPKNQARAARNVARFLEEHFIEPAQIEARLRAIGPARLLADWLTRPENAQLLARELTSLIAIFLRHDPPPCVPARARRWLRAQAATLGSDAAIAGGVAGLVKGLARGRILDDILALLRRTVDENRETTMALVQARSRWWIAASIDRELAQVVVNGALSVLDDLRAENSDLRRGFETAVDRLVDGLEANGTLTRVVGQARGEMIRSRAFDNALGFLGVEARRSIAMQLVTNSDAVADALAQAIGAFASAALSDPSARSALDARLARLAGHAIGDARPAIAAYVADVIAGWETDELNARFEAELGPDLQYIRVNGAVLGALLGGFFFAVNALLG